MSAKEDIINAAWQLLEELEVCACGCSTGERMSGHLVDCRWPRIEEAADALRALLPAKISEADRDAFMRNAVAILSAGRRNDGA